MRDICNVRFYGLAVALRSGLDVECARSVLRSGPLLGLMYARMEIPWHVRPGRTWYNRITARPP